MNHIKHLLKDQNFTFCGKNFYEIHASPRYTVVHNIAEASCDTCILLHFSSTNEDSQENT